MPRAARSAAGPRLLAAAAALLTFLAAASVRGEDDPASGDGVRVMTFNIRFGTASDGDDAWPERRELVFDVLREHRPDVVGLQESLRFQIDAIRDAVPGFGEVGVGRADGRTEGESCTILYRAERFAVAAAGTFWLSDTPEVVASKSWGNDIPRICTWARLVERASGRAFYLYNVHYDHVSQPSRARDSELVARRIRERTHADPFVLMGDFNAGEDNPAILYLLGRVERASEGDDPVPPAPRMVDTFRALHPDATGVGTFNGFEGDTSGSKIDHVFASPGLRTLEASIVRDHRDGRYPSDHFPVAARLRLPAPGETGG